MALLSKDQILGADDLPTEDVDVPEWGGAVRLRTLTGSERDRFEADMIDQRGKDNKMNLINVRARLVSLCVINEDGQRMFKEKEDVLRLGRKSSLVLTRLFTKAQEMNGMTDQDVEELAEGFDDDQSESSTSD